MIHFVVKLKYNHSTISQNEKEGQEYIKHESDEVRQQNDDLEHDVEILVKLVGNVMAGRKIEVLIF